MACGPPVSITVGVGWIRHTEWYLGASGFHNWRNGTSYTLFVSPPHLCLWSHGLIRLQCSYPILPVAYRIIPQIAVLVCRMWFVSQSVIRTCYSCTQGHIVIEIFAGQSGDTKSQNYKAHLSQKRLSEESGIWAEILRIAKHSIGREKQKQVRAKERAWRNELKFQITWFFFKNIQVNGHCRREGCMRKGGW